MPARHTSTATRAGRPTLARAAARWAALAAAVLATACGGGGTEAPGSPPAVAPPGTGGGTTPPPAGAPAPTPSAPPATSTWTVQPAGAPLDAAVALDTARAVSADVPLGGGRIVATGADGTTYTLDVPANGLLAATRITLTPVTQVSNLPFGETASTTIGVQFAPEGLKFFSPATLTVRPAAPAAIPIERQLFFGWESTGRALSLVAPDPTSAEILLGIDDPSDQNLLNDLFAQYERDVVQPRLAAAGTSCAAARLAIQTLIGVERQLQLLGASENGFGRVLAQLPNVSELCMKEEFEICRDEHVITRILPARRTRPPSLSRRRCARTGCG